MLIYRCALIIKYCMGDVVLVARAPYRGPHQGSTGIPQAMSYVSSLSTDVPLPSEKIRRGVSSPDFFRGKGDVCISC